MLTLLNRNEVHKAKKLTGNIKMVQSHKALQQTFKIQQCLLWSKKVETGYIGQVSLSYLRPVYTEILLWYLYAINS